MRRINEKSMPCQQPGTIVNQQPCQDTATSGNQKSTPKPRSKSGWTLTLNSFLGLTDEMLQHMNYFMTKRCNQDCLENFFSRIRGSGGNRTDPSAFDFASAYRLASVNIFSSKSKYTNCEEDEDKFMFVLMNTNNDKGDKAEENDESGQLIMDIETADPDDVFFESASFEVLDFITQNIITFSAGYVSRRIFRKLHLNFNVCEDLLLDKNKS